MNKLTFIEGSFKDENAFKQAVLKLWRKKIPHFTHFEIENEEKEPGMPDVLSMSSKNYSFFTEFKISDARGVITFQKSQPLFYKNHSKLFINILAWDRRFNHIVSMQPNEVIAAKLLRIKLPEDL